MLLLIIAGIVYSVWFDSLPVSVLTAALIVYRSRRPGTFLKRFREAWWMRQAGVGTEE